MDGEPFTDTAGQPYADFRFTVMAPSLVAPVVTFRFRLDYGEDVGNLHNPISDPALSEDEGPAQYGEVEDYVVENVPPSCRVVSIDGGPPLTAVIAVQDLESGLAGVDMVECRRP